MSQEHDRPEAPCRTPEHAELDAMFVHDLRSPIAAIAANFSFLRHAVGAADPALLEAIQDAEISTQVLQSIADNFALVSSLEAGTVQMAIQDVNLSEVMVASRERLAPVAASSEVRLEPTSGHDPAGPRVRSVAAMVRATLENLVHAAIRHTPRRTAVRMGVVVDGGRGVLEVEDGSPPVPPAIAQILFTRAGQFSAKREPLARYGRGLGLLVAGLAVRATGGEIEAVPREGHNVYRASWPLAK